MTNANINIIFGKQGSPLTLNGISLAHRQKTNNLFAYTALLLPGNEPEVAEYPTEPSTVTLCNSRLTHRVYSVPELMKLPHIPVDIRVEAHYDLTTQSPHHQHDIQMTTQLEETENTPINTLDTAKLNVCSPIDC